MDAANHRVMNTGNALGFFSFGVVMWIVPFLAPSLFTHLAIDGSSSRALWMQVMGTVQVFLGGAFLVRTGWTEVRAFAAQIRASRPLPALVEPQLGRAPIWAGGWPDNVVGTDFSAQPVLEVKTGAVPVEPGARYEFMAEHPEQAEAALRDAA
jgi:hypothetical protein